MAMLSEREKEEIVTLLARFHTPAQVVVQMREHWGVEVDRFQVRAYDPTNPRYEAGEKWRTIFQAARAAYLDCIQDVPIAHVAYRLNELQRSLDLARKSGNLVAANATLRQAAWETGRAHQRKAPGSETGTSHYRDKSPEERREAFARLCDEAFGRTAARSLPSEQQARSRVLEDGVSSADADLTRNAA